MQFDGTTVIAEVWRDKSMYVLAYRKAIKLLYGDVKRDAGVADIINRELPR